MKDKQAFLKRRRETIWWMNVEKHWTMREIAEVFKISLGRVQQLIMEEYEQRKKDIKSYKS